jgi:AcrR family transcriptional regulator
MRELQATPESATKAHILAVAIRLFGEHSFDTVSLRDITVAAKVNLGAVNYHYGSKLNLIRETLKSLASPINEKRIASLAEYETSLGKKRSELETVIRLLIEPFVRAARDKNSLSVYYPRLLILARTLPAKLIGPYTSEQHDELARRFVGAFRRASPELGEAEAFWRYDFTIGAMLNVVCDPYRSYRLRRLSGGLCDTDDPDQIIDELVVFLAAGMKARAPAVSKLKSRAPRETFRAECSRRDNP